jgi:hypothetical protein
MILPEEINMKKIMTIIFISIFTLFCTSCANEAERAHKTLKEHLQKKYNEEFEIVYLGKRSDGGNSWYEGEIYPSKYKGTAREYDMYYWEKGFVHVNGWSLSCGDFYGRVFLKESANEFYGKKLKELFGDNFLCVIDLPGGWDYTDFEEEMNDRKILYKERPKGNFEPISGGIYIFGRVENDEDREWYRTQIYEFVQFMKDTGMFEYVDLSISIIDERLMSKEFWNMNLDVELLELYNGDTINYIKKREKILNKIGDNYTLDLKIIDRFNKVNITKIESKVTMAASRALCRLVSKRFMDSNSHFFEGRKRKNYNGIEDVEFE